MGNAATDDCAGATRHSKLHKWALPQRVIAQELRADAEGPDVQCTLYKNVLDSGHGKLPKWAMPQRVIAQELRDTVNYTNGQCRNG